MELLKRNVQWACDRMSPYFLQREQYLYIIKNFTPQELPLQELSLSDCHFHVTCSACTSICLLPVTKSSKLPPHPEFHMTWTITFTFMVPCIVLTYVCYWPARCHYIYMSVNSDSAVQGLTLQDHITDTTPTHHTLLLNPHAAHSRSPDEGLGWSETSRD
jgi:hypothetical protein